MKTTLRFLRHNGWSALAAALGSQLLLGCNTHRLTPESEGRRIGEYFCAIGTRDEDALYARQLQAVAEIKAGRIKTRPQLIAFYDALAKLEKPGDDPAAMAAKRDSVFAKLDADFPQRDERLAVGRIIVAYVDQCDAASKAKEKLRPDTHIREFANQLIDTASYTPHHDSTGRELPPPVPPDAPADRP